MRLEPVKKKLDKLNERIREICAHPSDPLPRDHNLCPGHNCLRKSCDRYLHKKERESDMP